LLITKRTIKTPRIMSLTKKRAPRSAVLIKWLPLKGLLGLITSHGIAAVKVPAGQRFENQVTPVIKGRIITKPTNVKYLK